MKMLPKDCEIRIATEAWEFEQIHRLNYRTFVEEIPQHERNPEGRLVDRFHAENTYMTCFDGRTLAGMLVFRTRRPFSLDGKVPDLDRYLPPGCVPLEVRLLAIEPAYRKSAVFVALLEFAAKRGIAEGFDLAVLSATTRQLKLYRHLGCVAFAALVGTREAPYQPMYLTLAEFTRLAAKSAALRPAFDELHGAP
jgi:GNAT superfamily N-acetyltransferase